ncbi:MAG TPA: universal stress protein [Nocardioidaceae bacterium]|nr:universal stress protein [Nocardioidaceae bacterium]
MQKVSTTLDATGAVLVGHDGSDPSGTAVRWAARLAARLGTRLLVVRTWALSSAPRPATWSAGYVPPLSDFEDAVLQRLRRDIASLKLPEGAEVSCHVLHGSAGRRLFEVSRGAEMLVVGSRGIGGFRGLLLGSTATQLVGHAQCPVVVVPVPGQDEPADLDVGLGRS